MLLWTGIPSDTQSHLPSNYIPGQNSKTVVTILSYRRAWFANRKEGLREFFV